MTYKTHVSTGLLFSSALFLLVFNIQLSPVLVFSLIVSTLIGSSAPDLDTPTGKLWDKIPAGSLLSKIIRPVFIGGHRHLSHSLIGLGIFMGLFSLLIKMVPFGLILNPYYLILAFVVGYLSHLFADMFTEAGVPLFFPLGYHFGIPPDPLGKVRIKTGRWFENLIIYPLVNLALVLVILNYIKGL